MTGPYDRLRRPPDRRRRQRPLGHAVEYFLARAFIGVAGRLPRAWHRSVARAMAGLMRLTGGWPRRAALEENLSIAFGPMESVRRRALVRASRIHAVRWALEVARLWYASQEEILAGVHIDAEDLNRMAAQANAGRGLILACSHLGNWEWIGAWYALKFGRCGVVYKPMHNPRTDALVLGLRRRFGQHAFSTDRPPRDMLAHLRAGGMVAILADQDARRQGVFLPLFGRPASTSTGMAAIAHRNGVPILFCHSLREADGAVRLFVSPPLIPDGAADRDAETRRIMTIYNRWLEATVRLNPDQYFWWHRRWKTQPRVD
jgi:KDO2-lipid IV(A) lauroyltransferase